MPHAVLSPRVRGAVFDEVRSYFDVAHHSFGEQVVPWLVAEVRALSRAPAVEVYIDFSFDS